MNEEERRWEMEGEGGGEAGGVEERGGGVEERGDVGEDEAGGKARGGRWGGMERGGGFWERVGDAREEVGEEVGEGEVGEEGEAEVVAPAAEEGEEADF